MNKIVYKITIAVLLVALMVGVSEKATAQQKNWMVRLAKIEVDSAYLDVYKAALKVHTEAAIKAEPGVLTLYSMFEKEHPTRVTVLEIYASKAAYESHLKTAHFLKYKTGTLKMVKSLELIAVDPIALGVQPGFLTSKKN